MGRYHQAGVVPGQIWLGENRNLFREGTQVLWWKTYSPPVWLLNTKREHLNTTDLMGADKRVVEGRLWADLGECENVGGKEVGEREVVLVVPRARREVEEWVGSNVGGKTRKGIGVMEGTWWAEIWYHRRHVGLDDVDFAEDGVPGTLWGLIARRGLSMWKVRRRC